ncbi:DNA annealing helicase and endonuclease ZRANB3 [Erpetoichthys calabaricus]|uniref:DNA annealing helicase and endonuclease ZRANB3 n=1 Tax=Erpetoichthys calabaricus TaxID=27687 RepID=UPI002234D888|nr:DNA annealing helicase and endonuclease ZRANB3 [Erpetoichthys calabaricus]
MVKDGHSAEAKDTRCLSELDTALLLLPEKLQHRLMPFQKEGIRFAISRHGRCMIADEMGLGKTLQAISVAYIYKEDWPLLIVVPSSLKYPWIEEIEKWFPELIPDDINLVESKADTGRISTSKVTILGYGLLTSDATTLIHTLHKQNFKIIVVDESHYLKSRNAARSKILVPMLQKASRAILLTGTPALGRPEELFMQIDALYPKKFGTWFDFAKKYCNAHVRFFGSKRQWDCRGASNLDELHHKLNEIMIRRLKDQVLTQLPSKIRQRIPFDLMKETAKEACASFEEWEKLMRAQNLGTAGIDNPFVEVMGLITRMYKQTAIAKAGAVKDYIKMMLENDHLKFLVFAHHLVMLQACTEAVIEAKARYIRIDGSVPSSERIHLVHQFQNDPETRVAILSIQAAGQGLTFTAATHVVFAELYWNPGHIKQAEDRAHRIGQTSSVHIHYLIAKGTFDTVMWAMLNRKEGVTGNTLNGKKEQLKAEIEDSDKWEFLNFSSAWMPSENLLDDDANNKQEVFFSHLDKEKQHDIRSFFSPSQKKENKRKRNSIDSFPCPSSNVGNIKDEQDKEKAYGNSSSACEEEVTNDNIDDTDFEQETKRLKYVSDSETKCFIEAKKIQFFEKSTGVLHAMPHKSQQTSAFPMLPSATKQWNCAACTYSNNCLLSYCEICETPRNNSRHSCQDFKGSLKACSGRNESLLEGTIHRSMQHNCELISDSNHISDYGMLSDSLKATETEKEKTDPLCLKQSEINKSSASVFDETTTNCTEDYSDPVYEGLLFSGSRNTDRIYLYTKDKEPMNSNFVPLDVQLENWEDLPDIFKKNQVKVQILRFLREWNTMTAMKQRILRRNGIIFHSPLLALEDITKNQRRQSCTKRYVTKADVAQASISKVQKDGGSVRIVAKEMRLSSQKKNMKADWTKEEGDGCNGKDSAAPETAHESLQATDIQEQGFAQAVDLEGKPLCLYCQQPTVDVQNKEQIASWDTRFCSQVCQEEFLIRSNQSFMRAKVFETEHGICQQCGLNAQELFLRIRDSPLINRKAILENTWMARLSLTQLNEIIRNPTEGLFWQIDHIRPVYGGGGQCSLDNLQTLCTVCHKERTAKQAKERSQMKRSVAASKFTSDITRFLVKKKE